MEPPYETSVWNLHIQGRKAGYKSHVFKVTCFLWIVGLTFTFHTLGTNLHNYLQYDSIVTESSYIMKTPPFPEITVCAESMHSLQKGISIILFKWKNKNKISMILIITVQKPKNHKISNNIVMFLIDVLILDCILYRYMFPVYPIK